VCADLPEECYDTAFLSQHDDLARLGLRIQTKPSHLDNAISAISERRISLK
jgi:hypothetical protein